MTISRTSPRVRHWLLAASLMAASPALLAHTHADPAHGPNRTLGVAVTTVAPESLSERGLDHGLRVEKVVPGSAAAVAGLQEDDILVTMGGKPVYSVEQLQWLVRQAPEGQAIPLELMRGDAMQTSSVQFSSTPAAQAATAAMHEAGSGWPILGLRFQPMTPDLRASLGAPANSGVLVVEVMENSAAAKAGLAAGDIIVRIDRRVIQSSHDLHRAIGFFNPGDTVEVEVVRDRARRVLSAQLGESEGMKTGSCGPGKQHPVHGPQTWKHPWPGRS